MDAIKNPDWDRLYAVAEAQDGQFTTTQAADAGYSSQLLNKYLKSGRVVRPTRGVYRLVHFPAGEHEDLVTIWLWSEQQGVFSHETALMLHGLSDALPSTIHLTLPEMWRHRRLRLRHPRLALHHKDLEPRERAWSGSVPITTPARTVNDCANASVAPDLVEQASREGLRRGLFRVDEIDAAARYLGVFGRSLA
ncbi:MAG: type IV toxin-antitoxin system AbiEi family antitoxin domain-containing protein [Deltaproteobacteria bacterium]|nr:type IV toxin-antitoxin system AbiEi family antitoxin domain-containing protein [Deltaproteobacteria bacterium]